MQKKRDLDISESTVNALLSLTQDIFNGFNMSKSTAAIFIDFEKAYDSVWRELMV
jgi:hypothetical protein